MVLIPGLLAKQLDLYAAMTRPIREALGTD